MSNSAFWDQEKAARDTSLMIMDKISGYIGGTYGLAGCGRFLNEWREEFLANINAGRLQRCRHMASPSTGIINAWTLDIIRCPDCNTQATVSGEAGGDDTECDGCNQHFDELTPVLHRFGPLIIVGALCDTCLKIEHETGGVISS